MCFDEVIETVFVLLFRELKLFLYLLCIFLGLQMLENQINNVWTNFVIGFIESL